MLCLFDYADIGWHEGKKVFLVHFHLQYALQWELLLPKDFDLRSTSNLAACSGARKRVKYFMLEQDHDCKSVYAFSGFSHAYLADVHAKISDNRYVSISTSILMSWLCLQTGTTGWSRMITWLICCFSMQVKKTMRLDRCTHASGIGAWLTVFISCTRAHVCTEWNADTARSEGLEKRYNFASMQVVSASSFGHTEWIEDSGTISRIFLNIDMHEPIVHQLHEIIDIAVHFLAHKTFMAITA